MKYFIAFLMCLTFLSTSLNVLAQESFNESILLNTSVRKAKILEVDNVSLQLGGNVEDVSGYKVISLQKIKVEIKKGNLKGSIHTFENNVSTNPSNISVREGDVVMLKIQEFSDGVFAFHINDYYRLGSLFFIILLAIIVLWFFMGIYIIRVLLSVGITGWLLIAYLPQKILYTDYNNFLLWGILLLVLIITLILVNGFSKKTLAALIGTLGGFAFSLWVFSVLSQFIHVEGFASEEILGFISSFQNLDIKMLTMIAFMITIFGLFLDLAISVAAWVSEIYKNYHEITFVDLVAMAMSKFRYLFTSKVLMILFIYIGILFPLILTEYNPEVKLVEFLNSYIISDILVRSISIFFGLLVSIIITIIIMSLILLNSKKGSFDSRSNQGQFTFNK